MLTFSQLAPASACLTASAWMPGCPSLSNSALVLEAGVDALADDLDVEAHAVETDVLEEGFLEIAARVSST